LIGVRRLFSAGGNQKLCLREYSGYFGEKVN